MYRWGWFDWLSWGCCLKFLDRPCYAVLLCFQAFVRALADFTRSSSEKRRLLELCSREGSADYNSFIRDSNVCVLDLLQAFPSCLPPLSLLFGQWTHVVCFEFTGMGVFSAFHTFHISICSLHGKCAWCLEVFAVSVPPDGSKTTWAQRSSFAFLLSF